MTAKNSYIKNYSSINRNRILSGGKLLFEQRAASFEKFADAAYTGLHLSYPKFHKMDRLSKLGFLTAEVLLKDLPLSPRFDSYKVGIVLANKSSSLDTDLNYFKSLQQGIASPAVFVYTLPNIVIGEICIRHKIKGENTFFISDTYEISSQVNYVNTLMNSGAVDACICGWVELMNEEYKSFLYLVEKTENKNLPDYTAKNIETVYNEIPT